MSIFKHKITSVTIDFENEVICAKGSRCVKERPCENFRIEIEVKGIAYIQEFKKLILEHLKTIGYKEN